MSCLCRFAKWLSNHRDQEDTATHTLSQHLGAEEYVQFQKGVVTETLCRNDDTSHEWLLEKHHHELFLSHLVSYRLQV